MIKPAPTPMVSSRACLRTVRITTKLQRLGGTHSPDCLSGASSALSRERREVLGGSCARICARIERKIAPFTFALGHEGQPISRAAVRTKRQYEDAQTASYALLTERDKFYLATLTSWTFRSRLA